MRERTSRSGLLVALLAMMAPAGAVQAQQTTGAFEIAPRVGIAIPGGELWRIQDPGLHAGAVIAYYFTPYLGVRGEVTGSFLNQIEDSFGAVPAPGMTLLRFGGGLEVRGPIPRWQSTPMTFVGFLGAGATSASAKKSFSDGSEVDFSSTVLTASGGFEAGWEVDDDWNIFVSVEAHAMWFDEEDTAVFADRSIEVDAFDVAWEYPISLGARFSFR